MNIRKRLKQHAYYHSRSSMVSKNHGYTWSPVRIYR